MIPPVPDYDRDIAKLVDAYKAAVAAILRELQTLDPASISAANANAALASIAKILRSLNVESAAWVEANIPRAAMDGVVSTLLTLDVVKTAEEAREIAKFNRVNANLVKSAVADTQADLLAVTQNVERRVRASVRRAVADSMRANMAAGINGRRTINRDILTRIRADLGSAVETGIIDAAGRRWKPENYVDVVTRTKMARTHTDATVNEAVARDVYYGVISRHGATDACAKWEGRVVKLVPEANGDYPYIGDLPRREIFHPNCKHVISPIRRPERIEGGTG